MNKLKILLLIWTSIVTVSCHAQKYFTITTEPIVGFSPTFYPNFISTLNKEQCETVFNEIKEQSEIEFRYPQGNCHGRAHAMAIFLKKKNIVCAKIWNFAPERTTLYSKEKLFVQDPNHIKEHDTVTWGYHVAPIVIIQKGSKNDTVVLDPSIDNRTYISYKEWLKSQHCENSIYTFTDWEYYQFASINQIMLPNPYGQSHTMDKLLPNTITGGFFFLNPDNNSLIEDLAINETAYQFYAKEIQPYLSNRTPQVEDNIKLVEAVKSFEGVFRYNKLEVDNKIDIDFVLKNADLIKQYKAIYKLAFEKWKSKLIEWQNP